MVTACFYAGVELKPMVRHIRQFAAAALHLWEARDLQPDLPEVQHLLQQVYEALQQEQR